MPHVALVTGASMGLGELFASFFARDGHDVVIVARSEARLEALAERLRRVHKVKVHVVPADLTSPDAPQRIFDACTQRGLVVEYLVNNAGFGSTGPFLELPLNKEAEMVEVNIQALVKLTHLFAAPMKTRGSGKVLNIASTAGFQAGPFMATYYATKAFVISFSEALAFELKGSGVSVTCYCPGATHTEFAKNSGNESSRLFQRPGIAKAEDVAHDAYEAMMQGEPLAIHGLMNNLMMQSLRLSPRAVVKSITAALNTKPTEQ